MFGRGAVGGASRHQQQPNSIVGIVPYLVPVPVDAGNGYDDQASPGEDPSGLPAPVAVPQYPAPNMPPEALPAAPPLIPDGAGSADRACAPVIQDDTVHVFIALKNGTVEVGVAYWIIDRTLHYLTQEGSHNQVSLDLIDRPLSARMNEKGRVPLILPQ
jgi:hypothetical protein